jgi:dsRNA-specific ribonuclease
MAKKWNTIINEKCRTTESEVLGFSFHDRGLLVRALLRKSAYKHKDFPPEYRVNGFQVGLDILGERVLGFAIVDHFSDGFLRYENLNKDVITGSINGYREWYTGNDVLEEFALQGIALHKYIIWGTDEFNKKVWKEATTKILADSFEALTGAVYRDQGLPGVQYLLRTTGYYEKIDQVRFQKDQKKSDFRIIEST